MSIWVAPRICSTPCVSRRKKKVLSSRKIESYKWKSSTKSIFSKKNQFHSTFLKVPKFPSSGKKRKLYSARKNQRRIVLDINDIKKNFHQTHHEEVDVLIFKNKGNSTKNKNFKRNEKEKWKSSNFKIRNTEFEAFLPLLELYNSWKINHFFEEDYSIQQKKKNKKTKIESLVKKSLFFVMNDNINSAESLLQFCLSQFPLHELPKTLQGKINMNLGSIYFQKKKMKKALNHFGLALEIFSTQILEMKNSVSLLTRLTLSKKGKRKKRRNTIPFEEYRIKNDLYFCKSIVLSCIGLVFQFFKKNEKSLAYFDHSLIFLDEKDYLFQAIILSQMENLFKKMKRKTQSNLVKKRMELIYEHVPKNNKRRIFITINKRERLFSLFLK